MERTDPVISYNRIIDLTQPIVPGQGARPFRIEQGRTEELTDHVPVDHDWYIMHRVETISHIGTHIEAPYHCIPDGGDLASIPLDRLIGEAVVLDLSELRQDSQVGRAEMEAVAVQAGGVQDGDIVFLKTGYVDLQHDPAFEHRPSLTADAMEWLVEQGVKLVGTDLSGLEGPGTPEHLECHLVLLGADIAFIENLANLDQLSQARVFVCALPIPVQGLDAFPLRVVAFE